MNTLVCTTQEFTRLLKGDGVPERFANKTPVHRLDCELDNLTAEYVRRRVIESFDGMRLPEKRRVHVIRAILSCAKYQGLVWKENIDEDGPFFFSTERLAASWGEMFGEDAPFLSMERIRGDILDDAVEIDQHK